MIRFAAPKLVALVECMDLTRVRAERRRLPRQPDRPWRSESGAKGGPQAVQISFCQRHDEKRFGPSQGHRHARGDARRQEMEEADLQQLRSETREGLDRPDGDTQRACPGADRRSSCDHQEAGGRRFGRSSEKLEGDQQAFACDEIQTGLDANDSELEVTRPTGEPRRAARSRKAFPAHLERSRPSSSPSHGGRSTPAANRLVRSNADGRTGLRNGTVPPSLRYRGTVFRAPPNSFARRFVPQPSSCSRSIAATSLRLKHLLSVHRSRRCRNRPIPIAIHAPSHSRGGQFLNSADT